MKVLAIDSSGLTASVAIVEETQTIAEYTINYKKTHSQTLLPMIDEIVKMTEQDLQTIDAIAVSAGPGSFTGLRIGSATAKGLGMALDKPLIPVPTVDGLAYNVYAYDGLICPIMDARRNQVYTGIYTFDQGFRVLQKQMAVSIEELIDLLNEYHLPVIFLGDGVPVHQKILSEKLQAPCSFAPAYLNRQRAASVGTLGIEYFKQGKYETAAEHQPEYLRMSQAERERAEREKAEKVTIDTLTKEEAAGVAELEYQSFSDAWSEKSILETLDHPQTICLSAHKAGKLVGYVLAYIAADEAEIARIAVYEEARKKGVGQALLEELMALCREKNIGKILLDVRKSNVIARSFYEKNDFKEDGIRQNFYKNPTEDAVLMSCENLHGKNFPL